MRIAKEIIQLTRDKSLNIGRIDKMTTIEERQQHKEARRYRNMKRLVDQLGMKIANSQRSLKIVDEVLEKCSNNGTFGEMVNAIRRAN